MGLLPRPERRDHIDRDNRLDTTARGHVVESPSHELDASILRAHRSYDGSRPARWQVCSGSTGRMYGDMYLDMNTRRVTANLPADLVEEACRTTGKGITDTLVQGLLLVRRSGAARIAARLKGKLRLNIDVDASRERARH